VVVEMAEDTTDLKEKARIDELFRAPPPWYSNPKVVRWFILVGAILGIIIFAYLAFLTTLSNAMGPLHEDPLVSCKRLQLSFCSDEAQKPQLPSTAN
jgi:hypothetical protein